MAHSAAWIAVAEGGQTVLCRLLAEDHLVAAERGDSGQQRAEEDSFVERTDVPFNFPPRFQHLLGRKRAVAFRGENRAGQGTLFGFLLGHQVGAAQLLQLDAVLQHA